MGVAPASPGMPDRHSRPARPSATRPGHHRVPVLAGRHGDRAGLGDPGARPGSRPARRCRRSPRRRRPGCCRRRGSAPAGRPRRPTGRLRSGRSSVPARTKVRAGPPRPNGGVVGEVLTAAARRRGRGSAPSRPSDLAVTSTATRWPSSLLGDHAADLDHGALVVVGHHDRGGEPDRRIRSTAPGSPAHSVTNRPASAMVSMPCAITFGRPTDRATRSFQWMTLKSPEAPAYLTRSRRVTWYCRGGSSVPASACRRWGRPSRLRRRARRGRTGRCRRARRPRCGSG